MKTVLIRWYGGEVFITTHRSNSRSNIYQIALDYFRKDNPNLTGLANYEYFTESRYLKELERDLEAIRENTETITI